MSTHDCATEPFLRRRAPGPLNRDRHWPAACVRILAIAAAASGLGLGAAEIDSTDESRLPPAAEVRIDFVRDIKPLLEQSCFKCHSGDKPKSHFSLATRAAALEGGSQGLAILPGNSTNSPLIRYVAGLDEEMLMPPEGRGTPLTGEQVGLLRAWIDQGVAWEPEAAEAGAPGTLSLLAGGTRVSGDLRKYRELTGQHGDGNIGLEEFTFEQKPSHDSRVTVAAHWLIDDYALTVSAEKNDFGFARFGWSQFRRYSDDTGGYHPGFTPATFDLDRDLSLDIGRVWFDLGLTPPNWPRMVLGYEYQYRDGDRSTLQWGPVSNGVEIRNIYPSWQTISESVHILKFDVEQDVAGALWSDSFRGEWYNLSTRRFNESSYQVGAGAFALTEADEKHNHFQGANTFRLEKQFKDWFFASGAYLYSHLAADASTDVQTTNPALLDPATAAPGWHTTELELERDSHVFSLSSHLGPWKELRLSCAVQQEWTRQQGLGAADVDLSIAFDPFLIPLGSERVESDLDRSVSSEEVALHYTGIPFTALFAEARFQQESLGVFEQEDGGLTPFLRDTDTRSDLQDFRVGFNTSPWQRVALSAQFRHYDKETDYDNNRKEVLGQPYQGYPAFILWRDLVSNEAKVKLTLSGLGWLKPSLNYQWLASDYRTSTDVADDPLTSLPGGISPGGRLQAGTYDAHVAGLNLILTPWRRLYLSTTFTYQHARTATAAHDSPSVVPYEGDVYSVIAGGSFTLTTNIDLSCGYSFSTADFSQDNFADGLPLGLHYRQHALQAGAKCQVAPGKTLGLQYRFYHYSEPSSGSANRFDAHGLFATLAIRLG